MPKLKEKETLEFNAEVGKVLQLVIHSLYTNKDIFLRELISNASDACDKLRYLAITKPELIKDDPEQKISISYNKKEKILTIKDNGIGMSRKELVENLGTIARSGTQEFLKKMTGDEKKDTLLIGQFGVGFYSSFMVAERVVVKSRKAGETKGHIWESEGDGKFTLEEAKEELKRGTEITLFMKKEEDEFLEKFRISHIVKTYSDHISFPVELTDEDGKTTVLNTTSALWLRPKNEIKEEQYKEFYKHTAHLADDPWMTLHGKAEGGVEYNYLLFIPSTKPFDLFHPDRKTRVKLYVKRVFITEDNIDIIPSYLRFMRGIVDSEDLPLNISRETLQNNAILHKIRKSLVKKVISELKKKAEKDTESYNKFWENFGAVLKEGLCESMESRDDLLEVCRFRTSLYPDKLSSLDEYMGRMKKGQEQLYYLTGDDVASMQNSPQLEGFKNKGIEVILLEDHVDDFWVTVLHQYKEKDFVSITRSGIDLEKVEAEPEKQDETKKEEPAPTNIEKLVSFIKETLGDKVKDVKVSAKLVGSPACLASPEGALDVRMEKFLYEQKQLLSRTTRIFEINARHPIIKSLASKLDQEKNADEVKDAIYLLFDQATIATGDNVADASGFALRLNSLLQKTLN